MIDEAGVQERLRRTLNAIADRANPQESAVWAASVTPAPRPRLPRALAIAAVCCCLGATAIAIVVARDSGRRHGAPTVSVTPTTTTPSSVAALAPLSAHIDLPSSTIAAGSAETGYVVIDNNTGAAIPGGSCAPELAVALGNDQVHPQIAFTTPGCLRPPTIPVGSSRWPVTLRAVNESPCSLPGEPSNPPTRTCGLNGDPLPAGVYHTVFFGVPQIHPAPVEVDVVDSTMVSPCNATQLSITLGSDGAATGHLPQDFVLRNTSATNCTLTGAVRARQYDRSGHLLRGGSQEGSAYTFPAVPASPVVLVPGAFASFATEVEDVAAGTVSDAVQCPAAARTEFVLPNDGGVLYSPKALGGCLYGNVTVSNIVAGRTPPRF
jgi:hypothetical protein